MNTETTIRCGCGQMMVANDYGKPCDGCLAAMYDDEQFDIRTHADAVEMLEVHRNMPTHLWDRDMYSAFEIAGQTMGREGVN